MRPILIRGGRLVDPSRGTDQTADLLLRDEAVDRPLGRQAAREVGGDAIGAELHRGARVAG